MTTGKSVFQSMMRLSVFMVVCAVGANAEAKELVVGIVSDSGLQKVRENEPFANYIANGLASLGYTAGKVLVYRQMEELEKAIDAKEVDLVIDSPFNMLRLEAGNRVTIALRRWKGGDATYKSVIFVAKGSNIKKLADLTGKKIAFEDAGSTSSYFVPRSMIESAGLKMFGLRSHQHKPAPNRVNYVFSGSEPLIAAWVATGKVEAGAFSDKDYAELPDGIKKRLKIIRESPDMPRALVGITDRYSMTDLPQLVKVMSEMHNNPEGQGILTGLKKTSRFDAFTDRSQLDQLRKLYAALAK